MYSKRHYQSSVQSFTRTKPNHQGKKFFQAFIHFVNNAISWKEKILLSPIFCPTSKANALKLRNLQRFSLIMI